MEFALVLQELLRHRRALALGAVIAVIAAVLSVYRLDGLQLKARALTHSSASTEVFVDASSSVLGSLTQPVEPLNERASTYANFMASPTILALIGQRAGIPAAQLYAAGPVDAQVPRVVEEPTAVQRNVEITGEAAPYRLNFNNDPNLPTVGISAQAPTTQQSIALANAAAWALGDYVASVQASSNTPSGSRVVIRQLGSAKGGVSDGGISVALAAIALLATFVLWCVLVLLVARFRESWRAASVAREATEREATEREATERERADNPEPADSAGGEARNGFSSGQGERVAAAAGPARYRAGVRPSES